MFMSESGPVRTGLRFSQRVLSPHTIPSRPSSSAATAPSASHHSTAGVSAKSLTRPRSGGSRDEARPPQPRPQRPRHRKGPFTSPFSLCALFDRAICLQGWPCFRARASLHTLRILRPDFGLNLGCCAQLLPEEEDDLWHAYNLIAVGDHLQAVTVR